MIRDGKKRNVSATALQSRDEPQSCPRKTKPDLLGLGTVLRWQEQQTILVRETTSQIVWKLVKERNCNPSNPGAEAGGLL